MQCNSVYADNAATTPISRPVLEAMLPWLTEKHGNPSSAYRAGREAARAIKKAREQVAAAIGAQPEEIYFTSGGTEANNWAIRGNIWRLATSVIEHPSILQSAFIPEMTPVSQQGTVSMAGLESSLLSILKNKIKPLVSIMAANNEIGTIQPIAEIGALCREHNTLFHTDAVQAFGHIPIDVNKMNIDLLSISAHKFNGPKGVGALYIRKGVSLINMINGGGQEHGRRSGTENVAGIVGMGTAAELAVRDVMAKKIVITEMRTWLLHRLLKIKGAKVNGNHDGLPGIINICFPGVDSEALLLYLDANGIATSAGSACAHNAPSHVLAAIGLPDEDIRSSIRFSLSENNTPEEIDYLCDCVEEGCSSLRSIAAHQ